MAGTCVLCLEPIGTEDSVGEDDETAHARCVMVSLHVALNRDDEDKEGEHCADCGKTYGRTIWWADDALWSQLAGDLRPALLCPSCFSLRADAHGFLLRWRPEIMDSDDWRCECGDLNRDHESTCFRCGAGNPKEGG